MRNAILALIAVVLAACGKDLAMTSPTTVDLDVWSGRPNPTWKLTAEEEKELQRLLADLAPVQEAEEPPALGYRGFVLESPGREARVFGGAMTATEGGITRRYGDASALEKWLADLAAKHGHAGLAPVP